MTTETPIALSLETLEESYDILAPKIPEIVHRMYTRMFEVAPRIVQIVSYWGYIAVTPALIVAFVVCGWLIPRKD